MRWIARAGSLAVILFCAFFFPGKSAAQEAKWNCTPSFPFQQQWLGADAGYSIPLLDGRNVWIFGDTLYGDKREVNGTTPRMVRNSIGISTCKDGKWQIDYTMRRGENGKLLDFFESQHKNTWYWALDGVRHDNQLWVTLLCVRNSASSPLGFELCGTDMAHVTGIEKSPQQWKVSYMPLVPESVHANPSASTVIEGKYLYIFALDEKTRSNILTRIPLTGLDDPAKNLQYLGADDIWHDGLVPEKAKVVMQSGASEMSVRYHPDLKKWVAILVDPNLMSDKVLMRTAPELTGPWTAGEVIYHILELQKNSPGYDAGTFCYAGKEHPEYEQPGELLFTYACNTFQPKKLETEMNIYFPVVVRMQMPAAKDASSKR